MVSETRSSNRRRAIGLGVTVLVALIVIALIPRSCGPLEPLPPDDLAGLPEVSTGAAGLASSDAQGARTGLVGPGVKGGAAPSAARSALRPAVATGPKVAEVVTLSGSAIAAAPDRPDRPLACGDFVYAGERVVTATESRLGLLSDDSFAQLDAETTLAVGLTPAGLPDLTLEKGRVRVVDLRSEGAPLRLAVGDIETALIGNDVEAIASGDAGDARLCSLDRPIQVVNGGAAVEALPGQCVSTRGEEALLATTSAGDSLPLADAGEECPVSVAFGAASMHFLPIDAAIDGQASEFGVPPSSAGPDRDPCGDPGSALCGSTIQLATLFSPGASSRVPKTSGPRTTHLPGPLRCGAPPCAPPRGLGPDKLGFTSFADSPARQRFVGGVVKQGPKLGAPIYSKFK